MKKRIFILGILLVVLFESPFALAETSTAPSPVLDGLGSGLTLDDVTAGVDAKDIECGLARSAQEVVWSLQDVYNPLSSLATLSTLFKNSCWRDTIWSLDDERERLLHQMGNVYYNRCRADENTQKFRDLDFQLKELELERQFYWDQEVRLMGSSALSGSLQSTGPKISDVNVSGVIDMTPLMDWLVLSDVFRKVMFDPLTAFSGSLYSLERPIEILEDTFGSDDVNLLYMMRFVTEHLVADGESWRAEGYENFDDYFESDKVKEELTGTVPKIIKNMKKLVKAAAKKLKSDVKMAAESDDGPVQLYQDTMLAVSQQIDSLVEKHSSLLLNREQRLSTLVNASVDLFEETDESRKLRSDIAFLKASVHYNQFFLNSLQMCLPSDAILALATRVKSLLDAVKLVTDSPLDNAGENLAKRFKKARVKSLLKVCSQLETMYGQTGRDVAYLPFLRNIDGKTFCEKPEPECGVGQSFYECALKSFITKPRDPNLEALQREMRSRSHRDLSGALVAANEAKRYTVKQEMLYSLRKQYDGVYRGGGLLVEKLAHILNNTQRAIWNKDEDGYFNIDDERNNVPNAVPATHVSQLKTAYLWIWQFQNKIEGSCPAPKNPDG